jgi:hypothetical protein
MSSLQVQEGGGEGISWHTRRYGTVISWHIRRYGTVISWHIRRYRYGTVIS